MAMEELNFIKGFTRMCDDGWLQGWHERNGGNLTYRMTDEEVAEFVRRSLSEREAYYQRASIVIDCAGRSDDYIVEHLYNFMRYNK